MQSDEQEDFFISLLNQRISDNKQNRPKQNKKQDKTKPNQTKPKLLIKTKHNKNKIKTKTKSKTKQNTKRPTCVTV